MKSAQEHLRRGLSVIPCDAHSKKPLIQWKEFQSRLASMDEAQTWWMRWSEAGVAVITGSISNLVVVDVDVDNAAALEVVRDRFGSTPWLARTPSGGFHLGYSHPGGAVVTRVRVPDFPFPVDIRGDGGYVLVPPTPGYEWLTEDPFAQRPRYCSPAADPNTCSTRTRIADQRIPQGKRNATLVSLGGTMRRRGMSAAAVEAALFAENNAHCEPPLSRAEVERIVQSVTRYAPSGDAPRLLTAEEFANDLAPDQIVEGLIYRQSTHLLTGASKSGKSWLAYQLALCVQAGRPFLDLEVTKAKVLLVSLEMSAGMLRKRMESIHSALDLPMPNIPDQFNVIAPTCEDLQHLDLGTEAGCAILKDIIAGTNSELVILDTLYKFIPGCDPNSNAEMGPVFGRLNDLAQSTGAPLLILDHVAKGEFAGPVSQSAVGAQVKGGATRVIIALKRMSRGDGGRWQLDVDSHFGSWDEPIYYRRPRGSNGQGGGCVRCKPEDAFRMDRAQIQRLFEDHGEVDEEGRRRFGSKRRLTEALVAQGIASGNDVAADWIGALMEQFCAPEEVGRTDKPIVTSPGKRKAIIFTWRGDSQPVERLVPRTP